jgi:hypothetical protein
MKGFTVLLLASLVPGTVRGQGPVDAIDSLLDHWHHAAAVADERAYFGALDSSAVYLGTDPGERWSKQAFHAWAKPQFDKGSAWAFVPFDRHVTLGPDGLAWFDEKLKWFEPKLNTWMTGLRGSGVVRHTTEGWLIEQYNLTMEVSNDRLGDVIRLLRATPTVAAADARGILGTVRSFLAARAKGDSTAIHAAMAPGGRIVLATGPDSVTLLNAAWRSAGTRDSTPEVMWLGDGTVATVWAPFTTRLADKAVVCGVEEFQLLKDQRDSSPWQITSLAIHSRSCGESK